LARFGVNPGTVGRAGRLAGWLLGMLMFHHKTSKWVFKLKYALALVPFAVEVWAWWHYR
jgi:uncharacterized membrane protein YsdA (DUF1294 family)